MLYFKLIKWTVPPSAGKDPCMNKTNITQRVTLRLLTALLLVTLLLASLALTVLADGGTAPSTDDPGSTVTVTLRWHTDPADLTVTVDTTVPAGTVPTAPIATTLPALRGVRKEGDTYLSEQLIGWAQLAGDTPTQEAVDSAIAALPAEGGIAAPDGSATLLHLYPVYRWGEHAGFITETPDGAGGTVLSGGLQYEELRAAVAEAADGTLIRLTTDYLMDESTAQLKRNQSSTALLFDLNGHTIQCIRKLNIFWVSGGDLHVFSSRPGAMLYERGVTGRPDDDGSTIYHWSAGICGIEDAASTVTFGKYGDIPGENLTLRSGVILNVTPSPNKLANPASITVDGCHVQGVVGDSSALFVVRTYDGTVRIQNCEIYIGAEMDRHLFNLQELDSLHTSTKQVYADNCRIYTDPNYRSYICNNLVTGATLTVTGCIGNFVMGTLYPKGGTLIVGSGNAYPNALDLRYVTLAPGVQESLYYAPLQFELT